MPAYKRNYRPYKPAQTWKPFNSGVVGICKRVKADERKDLNTVYGRRRFCKWFMVMLARHFEAGDYGLTFKPSGRTFHQYHDRIFEFADSTIQSCYTRGFLEYNSVAWVWEMNGYEAQPTDYDDKPFLFKSGIEGLYQLCVHEFSHLLQWRVEGGREYGSVHNGVFCDEMDGVINKFSFNYIRSKWVDWNGELS